jgi:hypothetical protein
MRRSIFNIGEDLATLDAVIDEQDGDITAVATVIDAWLAEYEGELADKVDSYVRFAAELDAAADLRKREADRLTALAKRDTNKAAALRSRLHEWMRAHERDEIETAFHHLKRVRVGGLQSLGIDHAALPPEYVETVTTTRPDTARIRDDLMRGLSVPGATLLPRGERLSIK